MLNQNKLNIVFGVLGILLLFVISLFWTRNPFLRDVLLFVAVAAVLYHSYFGKEKWGAKCMAWAGFFYLWIIVFVFYIRFSTTNKYAIYNGPGILVSSLLTLFMIWGGLFVLKKIQNPVYYILTFVQRISLIFFGAVFAYFAIFKSVRDQCYSSCELDMPSLVWFDWTWEFKIALFIVLFSLFAFTVYIGGLAKEIRN